MSGVCLSLLQYKLNMGCFSSTSQHSRLRKNIKRTKPSLIKTPLAELHHYTQPHYIIFPSSYESFRQDYEEKIGESFPHFTVVRSQQELAGFDEDGRINILLVTCERPEDAQQIISLPNFHAFSLIGLALSFPQTVLGDSFKRKLGFRFGGFIKCSTEGLLNFMKEAKEPRSILFCHRDYGHINRMNLTFDFFVRRNHEYDRKDFFNWARHVEESRDFIERLQSIREEEYLAKLIMANLLQFNSLCVKALELLDKTRNPCVLAHVAWFYSIVFDSILASYPQSLKKMKSENKQSIYVWVALSQQDIAAITKNQNFMFSNFVIGSTKSFPPKPQHLADKNAYKFTINLPPDLVEPYNEKVDTGFLLDQDTVIFNLQSMYRLVSLDHISKLAEATYCSSGHQYIKKVADDRYQSKNQKENVRMMDTYDAYWLNALHVRTQLDLMLSLQFYHQYKRSVLGELQLIASKNSIDLSTNGSTSLASTAVSLIRQNLPLPSKALLQKIGDCEAGIMNIAAAEECYCQMQSVERQLIKKAYLYYTGTRRQERLKFRETIEELEAYEQSNKRTSLGGLLGILEVTFKAVMEQRGGLPSKDPTKRKGDNLSEAIKLNNNNLTRLSNFFVANYGKNALNLHNQAYQVFFPQYLITKIGWEFSKIRNEVGVETTQKALEKTFQRLDGLHAYLLPEDGPI